MSFPRWIKVLVPAAVLAAGCSQAALAAEFKATVVSVVDGDTLNVSHDGTRERVILYGIDCPELGQDSGEQARKFTDESCYKKDVTIDDRGKDSHGRTIGVVYLSDGSSLNEELVSRGLAWWSDKYAPKDTKLKQLQQAARSAQKGLWAAPNPIPPWIWRNGQKSVQAVIKTK